MADLAPQDRQLAEQLIDVGYKILARRLHPDHGGSHEDMVRLVAVRNHFLRVAGTPPARRRSRRSRPVIAVPVLGTEDAIRQHLVRGDEANRVLGDLLLEAKVQVAPDGWRRWLARHFRHLSPEQADRYMVLVQAALLRRF